LVGTRILTPKKIILIASAGIAKTNTRRNRLFAVAAKVGKFLTLIPPFIFWRRQLREKLYKSAGSDYLQAGPLMQTFVNIVREDLSADASHISTPTLIIWGAKDVETPVADARTLNRIIKGSNLEIVEQASHFVHHDDSELVAGYMRSFLRS
jgi:pimeloyl-ACP methyl ester carboxylesterase